MTTNLDQARRAARRFFWCWLVLASLFSMAANVAHALLMAPHDMSWCAAALAVVAPTVQIAATHAISHLVRTRANGSVYWCAFAGTVVLAVFAFMVSFDAIRTLAVRLGFIAAVVGVPVASIFPLVIDVSIAIATLCLLSQTPSAAAASAPVRGEAHAPPAAGAPVSAPRVESVPSSDDVPAGHHPAVLEDGQQSPEPSALLPAAPCRAGTEEDTAEADLPIEEYLALAEMLVRDKVTQKDPQVVAVLLADGAAGMRPTTIASRRNVHHSVVRKVLQAAEGMPEGSRSEVGSR